MSNIIELATTVFHAIKPDAKIIINYDEEEDVLYINYTKSPILKADFGRRFNDYIIRIKNNSVIGVTILNAISHSKIRFNDKPLLLTEPVTISLS
jgi:uncharacterized protein YuzE